MAEHLTAEVLRHYLLKTLSEGRLKAAHAHLEGCTECQATLETERTRLALLDALSVEDAPNGLAERTLETLASGHKPLSRNSSVGVRRFALVAVSLVVVLGIAHLYRAFVREELNHGTMLSMKQLGLSFKMAASESKDGRWPSLDPYRKGWAPDLNVLSQMLQGHPYILVSKNHPEFIDSEREVVRALQLPSPDLELAAEIMSDSFAYLGYTVRDEAEFEIIRRAKDANELPAEGVALDVSTTGDDVHPLREGVERFLITDINNPAASDTAQSAIPVLVEIATWKYKEPVDEFKGTNVLFMDGHVAFVPLGTFPVLPSILDVLSGL